MIIRDATLSDATAIAELTTQLGYPADTEVIYGRLVRLEANEDQIVTVAVEHEKIVGWMQAHASDVLESGFRVEIVGLIVSVRCRRRGVGRNLIARAEQWATEIGAAALVVRSNTKRVESHSFYPALGFSVSKTQTVYRKHLKREPNAKGCTPAKLAPTRVRVSPVELDCSRPKTAPASEAARPQA